MPPVLTLIPRAAVVLAGVAAGSLSLLRDTLGTGLRIDRNEIKSLELKSKLRLEALQARMAALEARVGQQDEKLGSAPSRDQLIAALEEVFGRTMDALNERFAGQIESMEDLRVMAAQTDELLERVLISLDSLQPEVANGSRGPGNSLAS